MTFTGRIRMYLILAAFLPAIVVLAVTFIALRQESNQRWLRSVRTDVGHLQRLVADFETETTRILEIESTRPQIMLALEKLRKKQQIGLFTQPDERLDFVEIIRDNIVLASGHRPGLVGKPLPLSGADSPEHLRSRHTVEYDYRGPHAAVAVVVPLRDGYFLYGGRYLEQPRVRKWQQLVSGSLQIVLAENIPENSDRYHRMIPLEIYRTDSLLEAIVLRSDQPGYYLLAAFPATPREPFLSSLAGLTAIVTLLAITVAVLLGMIVTRRARREVDNLVTATTRVASGDLDTPVMAYEEGEFSQLADAFTEMIFRLRRIQRELAASETVAAWQTVGRKIAHEIKNPLTPISISADDLRQSYQDNHPDFENILYRNCAMIKNEVNRLTHLLDQFVAFARMPAPQRTLTDLHEITDEITSLYAEETEQGLLRVVYRLPAQRVTVDRQQIKQLLINLIKNAFEAGDGNRVTVTFQPENDSVQITVEDSGPGFSDEQLAAGPQPYLSSKPNGSGLGLVICQRIAHDHGGSLELDNKPEGGAVVTVRLPHNHV